MLVIITKAQREQLLLALLQGGVSVGSACLMLKMKQPHALYILKKRGVTANQLKNTHPSVYQSQTRLATGLRLLAMGATGEDIAQLLGVRPQSMINHLADHPDILSST